MTNVSTSTARTIVQGLLDAGVQHVVVAPGSRSAPLSYAFAQAAAAGAVTVHVRIDERDAGFVALGLAKASGRPVPVVVTSGSAVANLLPAVVEAHYTGVQVVVLSADRPASSRGRRAAQTIAQANIFGEYASGGHCDLAVDGDARKAVSDIFSSSLTHSGPIHINVQFDMPLMPDDDSWSPQAVTSIPAKRAVDDRIDLDVPSRGVILAGDINDQEAAQQISELGTHLGWPIIWESTANVHHAPTAIAHGVLIEGHLPTPEMVLSIGAVGLSRVTGKLLRDTARHLSVHLASDGPEAPDMFGTAEEIFTSVPRATTTVDPTWLALWQDADAQASSIVNEELATQTLTGPSTAVTLWISIADESQLMIAASWPVRHIEAYAPTRSGVRTFGNRGANGIDGLISTAWGIASGSSRHTYLLVGDIAFLHDMSGLNVSDNQHRPDLTIVVADNDGSGIFSQLEQGAPQYAAHYEQVFGTPHGRDLWVIAESLGVPAKRVTTHDELTRALDMAKKIGGVSVIVCTTGNRSDEMALIKRINQRVSDSGS